MPEISTGGAARSRARSADVTMTHTPPSEMRQQSSSRSGRTMKRDDWWSSIVIGSRITACGLSDA